MSCETSGALSLLLYIKLGIKALFVIVPILLIVLSSIDLFKAVMGTNDIKETWHKTFKRIMYGVTIFFLPTIVSVIMNLIFVDNNASSFAACFEKATSENIEKLEKEEQAKEKLEKERKRQEEERLRQELEQLQSQITIPSGGSTSVANALGLPHYEQCDSRWGSIVYDTGGATLCSSSCGYTSLAMIAAGLSGNMNINPYQVVKDIRNLTDGGKTSRGYGAASTAELTQSIYISRYGIKAQEISSSSIVDALNQGKPVIALVPGHYITLSISSAGKIVLLDPFTNWASASRRVGEYNSLYEITSAYGAISWAAAYSRI